MSRLVKPIEYAKSEGISRQAVYAKIKKGLLPSKTIDGKIYIILEKELNSRLETKEPEVIESVQRAPHLIDVQELLNSKEQTISVLKESISDLKQTNTEINTTLRGEIELLKQVFTEMRNLYVKQVDYMSTEKRLELENKYHLNRIKEEVIAVEKIPNDEEECWITLDEFFEHSNIFKEKQKIKVVKRLKKAHMNADRRIKVENDEIYLSCYHYYEDILNKLQ
ncbi:DUF3972 domain-containing protein [bacterium]|nr:DUF3972 domain-containing protein [bacterium]MBU1958861.1 DUF3972 domain-containing protein [bacterium]